MLKRLMISAALGALMVSGATAQMSPPANPPAKADAAPISDAKFLTAQSTDQWVFSKFKGSNVVGPENEQVGSVSDMLFDKNGKVLGLIVGVGGFLGIGEKSVAIDMSAFQAMPADSGTTGAAGGGAASVSDPTNVKLKVSWTKDQLKNAPDFQYYKPPAPARTSDRPGGSPPTTGMAPRPATPER
jgi:PRC-barrel domain